MVTTKVKSKTCDLNTKGWMPIWTCKNPRIPSHIPKKSLSDNRSHLKAYNVCVNIIVKYVSR